MIKTYFLKPTMTLNTLTTTAGLDKLLLPSSPNVLPPTASISLKTLPPRQPLPTPVRYPDKPSIKLGLDVHLEIIMGVAQREHAAPQAPRKFTPDQLVLQVQ